MWRVVIFLLVVFGVGYGFARLADIPGEVVVTLGNQEVTVSLMVAGVAIVSILALAMITWWLIKSVLTSPQRMQRFFRARRRDRGYQSLSTGIIAAGAGDAVEARRMVKQAEGLLNSTTEPLIQLLDAQATMLEGRHDDARKKFEAMLEHGETRMLGLRGLYMEAQRLGDREAERHYAEKAAELAPQLGWAGKAALDLKTASGDWEGALQLLDRQKASKAVGKEDMQRKRAVLLTAMAIEHGESDPAKARTAALEAHKLAPGFAPAAVAAAEACLRLNDMRKGVKVLEQTWKAAPHPDVALAYVNARPGDSAADRLKKARRLEQLKPNHVETSMILAQMALEARDFELARSSVAAVLRQEPRESAYMLMADIEDAQTGDQGKVREWLSRAVRSPRDPAWTADGYVAERWAPFSPVTGRIDAFEWKVPVERIGGAMIENDLDPMVPGVTVPKTAAEGKSPNVEKAIIPAVVVASADADVIEAEPEPSEPKEAEEAEPALADTADTVEEVDDVTVMPAPVAETPEKPKSEPVEDNTEILAPIPDDPGIDPSEERAEESRRFRLF